MPAKISVYVAAHTLGNHSGPYGIAAVVLDQFNKTVELTGSGRRATDARAEIKALILGLSDAVEGAEVTVYTRSTYVYDALTGLLDKWEAENWKNGRLPHFDLWAAVRRLEASLTVNAVYVEKVSQTPLMAHCFDLARDQALEIADAINKE